MLVEQMLSSCASAQAQKQGWPEPNVYVYAPYILCICTGHKSRVGQNLIYTYVHRIFGDFQAKNTVCTPYTYDSGQPYTNAQQL